MSDSQSQPKTLFQIIKGWLRNGSIEVASASKVGRVRLNLADLRQDRDQALQKLGGITYQLIQKGALKSPAFSEQADKVKSIEKMIIIKEAEIKQHIKEKERKLLGAPDVTVSPYQTAPRPQPKPQPQPQKPAAGAKPKPVAAKDKPAKPAVAPPKPKPAVAKDKPAKSTVTKEKAKTTAGKTKAKKKAGTKPESASPEKAPKETASAKEQPLKSSSKKKS